MFPVRKRRPEKHTVLDLLVKNAVGISYSLPGTIVADRHTPRVLTVFNGLEESWGQCMVS